jgi:hypothetical protein
MSLSEESKEAIREMDSKGDFYKEVSRNLYELVVEGGYHSQGDELSHEDYEEILELAAEGVKDRFEDV